MIFRREGGRVTLEMSEDDYERLLIMLSFACGSASREQDKTMFYRWLDFINQLNSGNERFIPYEIPERYREPVG